MIVGIGDLLVSYGKGFDRGIDLLAKFEKRLARCATKGEMQRSARFVH
jgi:hypothetical protein